MATDAIFERAVRAYERGRALHATKRALPLAFLVVFAIVFGARMHTSVFFGVVALIAAWVLSWRGQSMGRAVLPGMIAGAVPLGLALAAQAYGHVCTGSGCMSLCVPACSLGGAVAGALIVLGARRATARSVYIASASGLALMVGSLGCSCVGYGGVLGLAGGLVLTIVPSTLAFRRA